MHFSDFNDGSGAKAGKFALVAGLHALVAIGVINTMNSKMISFPKLAEDLTVMMHPEITLTPPPPPEPPRPQPRVAPPQVVVPPVEVDVPPPPMEPQVQATTETVPALEPAALPSQSDAPPAESSSSSNGTMRSAVLADANGCALPEYPTRAARNGETGTVTLALLVGADGKVQSSRVQQSSGSRDLDKAAVNALSLCQFKPAMNNGVPEAGWAQIAYVWKLE